MTDDESSYCMLECWLVAAHNHHYLNVYGNMILGTVKCYNSLFHPARPRFVRDYNGFILVLVVFTATFAMFLQTPIPYFRYICFSSISVFMIKMVWDWVVVLLFACHSISF